MWSNFILTFIILISSGLHLHSVASSAAVSGEDEKQENCVIGANGGEGGGVEDESETRVCDVLMEDEKNEIENISIDDEEDEDEDYEDYEEDEYSTEKIPWDTLECDELFETALPIHNETIWMLLRGAYSGVVGDEVSTISPLSVESGMLVPFRVENIPDKGRGVIAAADIKQGTPIWTTRQTARFYDRESYLKFLNVLPRPLACDVMQWAYVQDVGIGFDDVPIDEEETYYGDEENNAKAVAITVDFDEGILINDVDRESGEESDMNIGCDPEGVEETCFKTYFAIKDIKAGEELIVSYNLFVDGEYGWSYFDLKWDYKM